MWRPDIMILTPGMDGGSWTRLSDIIRQSPEGRRILVIGYGARPGGLPATCRVFGIPYFQYVTRPYLASQPFLGVMFSFPLAMVSVVAFLFYRPRAVICNGLILAFYVTPLLRLFRRKILVSYHGWTQHYVKGFAEKLTRLYGKYLDYVFANSKGSRKDLCRLVSPEKVLVSEHYADPIFFDARRNPDRKFRDIDFEGRYAVLYVGRLDEETNVGTLVRSIPLILEEDRQIVFLFCGKGSELVDAVRDLANTYQENVYYLDYIGSRVELSSLYAAVDVVWSCGDDTYLTRPAVESLATGTPIIIPDKPNVTRKKKLMDVSVPEHIVPAMIGRMVETDNLENARNLVLSFSRREVTFDAEAIRQYARKRYSIENLSNILEVLDLCCTRHDRPSHGRDSGVSYGT